MNLLRGVLQLSKGGWVVDDRISNSPVYRREFGGATIRVPYILSGAGYMLRRTVEIGPERPLMDEGALPIISEIAQQLEAADISAQVEGLIEFQRWVATTKMHSLAF